MSKKKIYRAGLIPYIVEDGEIKMMFMTPSDQDHGAQLPQIAKGKMEEDEVEQETALREAQEELGLFSGNIIGEVYNLGTFMGRTTIFTAKIKDKEHFGDPDGETGEINWLTESQFIESGRDLHRPIIQAAVRKIKKVEGVE